MALHVPSSNSEPLYVRIYAALQRRILNGEWPYGAMLPTEFDFSAEYQVSRGTIRQVLAELEKEKLIRRERGRGTFVAHAARQDSINGLTSQSISFIVPYVRDSFVPTILLGVENVARAGGFSILFNHVENDLDKQEAALRKAIHQGVAGIILYPVNSLEVSPILSELVAQKYPLVLVDRYVRGLYTDYVTSDNFGGGLRATQHLLTHQYRRIAYVSWRDSSVSMEHRRAGYRQAILEAGLITDPDLEWEVEGYPEIDLQALTRRLDSANRPEAIFAGNDQLALAIQRVARSLGLSIPRDLALVGFDNLEISAQLEVPLTTIAQPAFEMGKTAGKMVICKISGQETCIQQHILPTELIVRQSCCAG